MDMKVLGECIREMNLREEHGKKKGKWEREETSFMNEEEF